MSSVTLVCGCGATLRTRKGKTRTDAANSGWFLSRGLHPSIECVECAQNTDSDAREVVRNG